MLQQIAFWPEADQEELAGLAREIEARRSGVHAVSDDERRSIDEAIAELDAGKRVSESEMAAFRRHVGVA